MRNHFSIILFLLVSGFCLAQNSDRKFIGTKEGPKIEVAVSDGKYQILFYNESIVETSFIPNGQTYNPESHAVVLQPSQTQMEVIEKNNVIEYQTSGITVKIQKAPFQISYLFKGKELLSEKNGYIKKDSTEILDFNLNVSEALFGGGARALGMNRRGNRLQLYNRAHYGYGDRSGLLNFTMPLVMSSNIYAVHFDNAPIGYLDLDSKKDNTLAYETISGRKTYQVIAADSWTELIDNYTDLTGKQPLPARWVLGNFASRFGYHSEKEVRNVVDRFKADKIPLEAIILDLYWFGKDIKGTMGNFEFLKDSFPTPEKMISDLKEKDIRTILITEPFILTTSGKWQEAVDKKILATDKSGKPFTYDFYFGNTGLIDIFKPDGNDWFWNIYKKFIDKGVDGWWGDLGEPEVHPSKLQHATGSADELHNIYGHNWAKLVFDGYKKDFPNVRPFILMRSGYSGSQHFGMIPWSGDVGRSWGGLESQTEIALEMGMQGMGYMHSDLGGFAGDNVDNELYTRWLQYGVFQPVFRPHAAESVPPEPIFREAKTKELAKKSIELRYKLMPYNYTIAFENNQKGTPLMRPLFFDEPENIILYSKSDTYLWGNEFLVSMVSKPGLTKKEVYFPKNSNWFDFYTDKKYVGGSSESVALNEQSIPTFVRGGAFIPMIDVIQNTKQYSTKNLNLHYYYDESVKESVGKMYNDDGELPNAFEKGRSEILNFGSKSGTNSFTITIENEKGDHLIEGSRNISLIIHNIKSKPEKVSNAGKKIKSKWDKKKQILTIPFIFERNHSKKITIQTAK